MSLCGLVALAVSAAELGASLDKAVSHRAAHWVVAAFAGPALLRSQFTVLGNGQKPIYYGPADRYVQFREWIDSSIDDISAARQSIWITGTVIPAIEDMPLSELARSAELYIKSIRRIPDDGKEKRVEYINNTKEDGDEEVNK